MANLNRENLITVDMKNATISNTAGNMTFYITDKKTSNIFCKLAINESESNDFAEDDDFIPIENALDYKITLRVVKPNHEPKELEFTLLNEKQAIFMVDLPDDYKDRAGTYKCELLIESNTEKESGAVIEPEAVTTNSFTYTVNKSVFNDLDNIIDNGSDNPLINILATKEYVDDLILVIDKQYITADDFPMGNSTCKLTGTIVINGTSGGDLTNFNNQLVYAQKVKGIGGLNFLNIYTMDNKYFHFDFNESSVKLYEYEYVSKEYLAEELESLTQGIATVDYVDESIAAIPDTDLLINYTTNSDVRELIKQYNDTIATQNFASKDNVNSAMQAVDENISGKIKDAGYTTESYVNDKITSLANGIASMKYVTETEVNNVVDNKVNSLNFAKESYVQWWVSETIKTERAYISDTYATDEDIRKAEDSAASAVSLAVEAMMSVDDIARDYASKDYVATEIANAQLGGSGGSVDLSNYATKEYVHDYVSNNAGSVDLSDYVHKDTFSDRISECVTLTELLDMNYVTADYVHEYVSTNANPSSDISYDIMTNYVEQKLEAYDERLSNRGYITSETMYDYVNGRFQSHNEDIAERGYLTNESASETYATNDYVNNMLGNIETLLGEI